MRNSAEAIRPGRYRPSLEPDRSRVAPRSVAPFVTSRSKRAFDVAFALLALVLASPLIALIVVAIRLTSPGPVFFRQRRLGAGGVPFTVLKFRTMHSGCNEDVHRQFIRLLNTPGRQIEVSQFKLQNDGRITTVGRFLRRTSLDELPQFVNVLAGEMSVVGPRPPLEYEVDDYEAWQVERLSAKPGITGLWQVSARNRVNYQDMCRIDIEYIRNWSFMTDVIIVLKTPWVMISNSGNAA